MRLLLLFSGGKDSNLALYRLLKEGHEILSLLTVIPRRPDSWMFHRPNVELAKVQAACMNLPWQSCEVSGEKEIEISELKAVLSLIKKRMNIEGIATGAIASKYQKERVENLCKVLGLKSVSPLWGAPEIELLTEMLSLKFEVYFTSVSAEGLDMGWLGKVLDWERLNRLQILNEKYGLNLSGEGGEYETFVCDSPLFRKRIRVIEAETLWHHNSGVWNITRFEILKKPNF
ncbi:MAG: diphthine--ammonia ligase [Candidatus Methanomethylicaceae archaeon]